MKREEIIRDLVERSSGAGRGQYISIRCDVAREIVALLKEQEARVMPWEEVDKSGPYEVKVVCAGYCMLCGKPIETGRLFVCPECGAKMEKETDDV